MSPMAVLDILPGEIAHHLWLVSFQVCVLAALALIAERLHRNAPPSFHYWIWMFVNDYHVYTIKHLTALQQSIIFS
jgi:hypothetical protein